MVAIVDDEDLEVLSQHKWHAAFSGWHWYAKRNNYKGEPAFVFMHRTLTNAQRGEVVDHINGNTLDNRKENLRRCSIVENSRNAGRHKGLAFKGVFMARDDRIKKWGCRLYKCGKVYYGKFQATAELAAAEYDRIAQIHFGDFARKNFQ